jgi:SAM-dependent methyltransferase
MDELTREYYQKNAPHLAEYYSSCKGGISAWFDVAFPPGTRVLDIGTAAGRDVSTLVRGGRDAFGIDPCQALIDHGNTMDPRLKGRLSIGALPDLTDVLDRAFDGVLCSAVLMHLPEEYLFDSAFEIRRVLKPGGRLLVSLPLDKEGAPVSGRDENGRLFSGLSPDRLRLLLSRLGFISIGRWDSEDGLERRDRKWVTELYTLDSGSGERSIDRIESVLNRDRKVATYKLALFRALAEIATTGYNQARWRSDGSVALPLTAVAKKWLEYFWPIVSSRTFIPQIQGEQPSSKKPIAFRPLVGQLADRFRLMGGLPGFLVASRAEKLEPNDAILVDKVMRSLSRTIQLGPVTYAGGGGTPRAVFAYDKVTSSIIMDSGLWQELCLMGSWIRDAAILRWAELTERLARQSVTSGQVLALLLEEPSPARNVHDVVRLFQTLGDTSCIWTGERIQPRGFDVDHAIPFSLWHNNDLWNLFPVKRSINQLKKDKLPTQRILIARKATIVNAWEKYSSVYPERFRSEVHAFTGQPLLQAINWPDRLFSLFSEAVEITAIQRGSERWEL